MARYMLVRTSAPYVDEKGRAVFGGKRVRFGIVWV